MITINSNKIKSIIHKAGQSISSPEQRLIIGATALATQPYIDLHNKDTDEDTRTLTACKSIAKIIAGTSSGVLVRRACITIVNRLSETGGILCPKTMQKQHLGNAYADILGTLAATFVMLGTNFIWDAPITKKLTNYFYAKVSNKEAK